MNDLQQLITNIHWQADLLKQKTDQELNFKVIDLKKQDDNKWKVKVKDLKTGKTRTEISDFVFILFFL